MHKGGSSASEAAEVVKKSVGLSSIANIMPGAEDNYTAILRKSKDDGSALQNPSGQVVVIHEFPRKSEFE